MGKFDLIAALEDGRSLRFGLTDGRFVIGREEECDICIPADSVSGRHALLTLSEEEFILEDLDGTSGTMVGRYRVEGPQAFGYPASMCLGGVSLMLSPSEVTGQLIATVSSSPQSIPTEVGDVAPVIRHSASGSPDLMTYTIGEEIAKGGMGSILEAIDRSLGRTVAMKVLLPQVKGSDEARKRFVREATVLGKLEHPNIVPIHEMGTDEEGNIFYTMKLVKGRTLAAILSAIQKGDEATIEHYTLDRLLSIFNRVCDALAFTHFNGVIHRDLKPDNIMVGEFGEVLVMDWGIAKVLDDEAQAAEEAARASLDVVVQPAAAQNLTLDGAVVGTPHYMAPEQARGALNEVDPRSDVFALGGMLYSILTLRPPVRGDSIQDVLTRIARGEIEPPESLNPSGSKGSGKGWFGGRTEGRFPHCPGGRIPSSLSKVAMRALEVEKERRYPNVGRLAADVDAYRHGFATTAEEVGTLGQLGLLLKRHRKELIAALAIWIGLSVSLQGGKMIGSLATSFGFVACFVIVALGIWVIVRQRVAERQAVERAEQAEAERDQTSKQEAVARQHTRSIQRELDTVRSQLARTHLDLATAANQVGDFEGSLKALRQVPEDLRNARWLELFDTANGSKE